ncbi:phosphatase [Aureococcus anophagefferens]|nr:phosphatase [Aureococcus anophagefferens]
MWRRVAMPLGGYIGLATAANVASPLQIVWDLDETLISSKRVKNKWREDQCSCGGLAMVPGVEQHVSTAASPGYAANVVELLDPRKRVFTRVLADQPSRGKDVTLAIGDRSRRRAVLVDNRPSCHSPQPANGLLVEDFVASTRVLALSGGRYALGGAYRVRASDRALSCRWPLELGTLRRAGDVRVDPGGTGVIWGRPRRADREAEEAADDVRFKLAVAAVASSAEVPALAEDAARAGAAALLVVDAKNAKPRRIPRGVDFPVISAGSAAAHALANQRANRASSWDDKTRVTTADLRAPVDAELRRVALRLFLCYFVPDVSWVLRPVDAAAKKARW